jgi:hypothetical protein
MVNASARNSLTRMYRDSVLGLLLTLLAYILIKGGYTFIVAITSIFNGWGHAILLSFALSMIYGLITKQNGQSTVNSILIDQRGFCVAIL